MQYRPPIIENTDPHLDLVFVAARENAIVNRLNKTKVVREVDHEQERIDRIKKEKAAAREIANTKVRRFSFSLLPVAQTISSFTAERSRGAREATSRGQGGSRLWPVRPAT